MLYEAPSSINCFSPSNGMLVCSKVTLRNCIVGDPGADSGDKRKSKREETYGTKKSKERRSLLFFVPYFSARLQFLLSPLSAPGSPRMRNLLHLYIEVEE